MKRSACKTSKKITKLLLSVYKSTTASVSVRSRRGAEESFEKKNGRVIVKNKVTAAVKKRKKRKTVF